MIEIWVFIGVSEGRSNVWYSKSLEFELGGNLTGKWPQSFRIFWEPARIGSGFSRILDRGFNALMRKRRFGGCTFSRAMIESC